MHRLPYSIPASHALAAEGEPIIVLPEVVNPNSREPVQIVIADHYDMARRGLAAILRDQLGFEVVGDVSTPDLLRRVLAQRRVDVILFDLGDNDQEAVALVYELSRSHPASRILAFTARASPYQVHQLLNAGVRGCLLQRASMVQILSAIRTVHRGRLTVQHEIASGILGTVTRVSHLASRPSDALTPREVEVLQPLVDGASNKEIALQLCIASKTVETRVGQICAKLGARSRTGAAVRAVCLGLVRPSMDKGSAIQV
jgi:DNA-binding NarL/FixJ family response regulator